MLFRLIPILIIALTLLNACNSSSGQQTKVDANAFEQKLNAVTDPQLIDVRTPEEFKEGFIKGATNINWNGKDFDEKTALLDKKKPVYVYCLSGGRSSAAASKLSTSGFTDVIELQGGIMAWNRAGKSTELRSEKSSSKQTLSQAEFDRLLATDKLVLIDFNAVWCGPCKILAPMLEELALERKETLTLVKIDADKNPELVAKLAVEGLPTLILYKNKTIVWRALGLIQKAGLESAIESVK